MQTSDRFGVYFCEEFEEIKKLINKAKLHESMNHSTGTFKIRKNSHQNVAIYKHKPELKIWSIFNL